jgi:3-deoxy-7-phosphoheptulonate synthase
MEGQRIALPGCAGSSALLCRPLCSRSRARPQQTRGFLRQQSVKAVIESPALPFAPDAEHLTRWAPDSWRQLEAQQQPNYPDRQQLQNAVDTISRMPPLVFAGECRNLQERLAKCATGEAFLVQGTSVHLGLAHA